MCFFPKESVPSLFRLEGKEPENVKLLYLKTGKYKELPITIFGIHDC